jgi:hypothetical protein
MNDPGRQRSGPAPAGLAESIVAGIAVVGAVLAVIYFPDESTAPSRPWNLAAALTGIALVVTVVTFQRKGPIRIVLCVATGIGIFLVAIGWLTAITRPMS